MQTLLCFTRGVGWGGVGVGWGGGGGGVSCLLHDAIVFEAVHMQILLSQSMYLLLEGTKY